MALPPVRIERNLRLIGHNSLGAGPNAGEGLAMKITPDGRRLFYVAHENPPMAMSILDVTDPTQARAGLPVRSGAQRRPRQLARDPRRHAPAGQPVQAVRPAAGRLHHLRPVRPDPAARGRLLRHIGAALAGCPLRLVHGRRVRPHHHRRRRLRVEPPQRPPVLHDRRRATIGPTRARSGGGGYPASARAIQKAP